MMRPLYTWYYIYFFHLYLTQNKIDVIPGVEWSHHLYLTHTKIDVIPGVEWSSHLYLTQKNK
jgi:hypothetical protein